MIKATATTPEGPMVIFGLSRENIKRLQDGRPIRVDMTELGMKGHTLIFAGETEESMAKDFQKLIGPDTIVHGI